MASINLSNFNVSSTGTVTFSGVGSGINFQQIASEVMQAKQVPIDNLQTSITNNQTKITDLQKFQGLLNTLQSSLGNLYGAVSFDNSSNDFEAKVATETSSRTDGLTPTPAAGLLSVNVTNQATAGNHQIQVLQLAQAEKIGSGNFNSLTTDLGTASGGASGSISGSFTINGATINVQPTDKLSDLVSEINAADTGSNPTGVTASIVSVSPTQNILVLSADQPGTQITLADPSNTGVLGELGISSNGGTTLSNLLQASQQAEFYADGITDPSKYQSASVSSASAAFSTYASGVSSSNSTFQILDSSGNVLGTVTYNNTDSLNSIASKISAITGVTANVVTTSTGQQLQIASTSGSAISIANDTGGLVSAIGIANSPLLITRNSNTISDLYTGVTLNLIQAEPGTTVNIAIQQNTTTLTTDIQNFVTAYNAVVQFVNTEDQTDPTTGAASSSSGPLFQDPNMDSIAEQLGNILGEGTQGVSADFSSLSQIGINFVDNSTVTDPTLDNTLTIDTSTLQQALQTNPSQVQDLFTFNFSSSNPQVTLIGFDGTAQYNSSGYALNLAYNTGTGSLTSANIGGTSDGADNGTATVSGQTITMNGNSGASGLQLYYSGNSSLSNVQLNFTMGFAAQMYFALQLATDPQTGSVQNEINGLQTEDTNTQNNITIMQANLAIEQQTLTNEFNNAETTISSLNDTKAYVLQLLNGTNNSNSSSGSSSSGS